MEDRLMKLVKASDEANRTKWAEEWKRQGKKVIGTICPYVPEEVIYAADMLPWRVWGSTKGGLSHANVYRPPVSNQYYTHVIEGILAGEINFLDGLVTTNRYDDSRRCYDVLLHVGKPQFLHIMYIPTQDTELGYRFLARSINILRTELAKLQDEDISDDSLRHAIGVFNKTRRLLKKMYALRKREIPSLTGAEALGISMASMVMPKDEFNKELEALLPYLEERRANLENIRPRLLVSSDQIDNRNYLEVIESTGAIIAMDDMDTGSRYFWEDVEQNTQDSAYALAKRYIRGPADARMFNWDQQVNRIIDWVKEYRIDAVVELFEMYYYPRGFRSPFLRASFKEKGIPFISLETEYRLSHEGRMRTQIGAFLETIQNRASE